MKFQTKTIHAGYHPDGPNQPVVPPIHPSSVWTHPDTGLNREKGSNAYIRFHNPNRTELEQVLCALENGAVAMAFSSGMAAITTVFQALDPGDHVLVCRDVYHGTRTILNGFMKRWGLSATYVDATEPENFEMAITPKTKLIWLESPSNPMLFITDIQEVCRRISGRGIKVCVDNTWATPVLQNPLDLGADVVMHSCTKYLSGHSDLLSGAIICKEMDDFSHRIRQIQQQAGAVLSPFDSWMLVRSIKSLVPRMNMHCENAAKVAAFLKQSTKVQQVFYPGLAENQGHHIARRQMSAYGGMVSFLFMGNQEQTLKGISGSRIIKRATSLGGVESTWEHRKSSEGEGSPTPENLVRISVGLEAVEDLLVDIEYSLGTA